MTAVMSAEEMNAWLVEIFPQVKNEYIVEAIDGIHTVVRMPITDRHLRPGGTVSGPSMFALADVAAYVATMACIGKEALTVTTSCALDFMRKPESDRDLVAHATMLKLGRTMAVTSILIYSDGNEAPVARANMTYAIPPKK